MRAQPVITCTSVTASGEWYQRVLGLDSGNGGDEHEMLVAEGTPVLQLHELDYYHEHPELRRDERPLGGNGVALWFETDDLDGDVARIRATDADVTRDVHVNPAARHREIWLRDPDGYVVVLAGPFGDVEI